MSEPLPPAAPKKPLGVLRGLAAALGILIMVLTGGCAVILAVLGASTSTYGAPASELVTLAGYIAPPFIVGLAIFLAATRLGRK